MKRSTDRPQTAGDHARRSPRGVARKRLVKRSTTLVLLLVLAGAFALVAVLLASAHPNHTAASVVTTETPPPGGAPPTPHHELAQSAQTSTIVGPRDLPVPILMYHIIAQPAPGAAYPLLWLPVPSFQAQMQYLRAHGFHPVTLQQVYDFWNGKGVLPIRPVVLTFDDGYRSVFASAVPLLHRYGWPAVLNLALSHLGDHRDLWPSMVETMIAWGWEVDSHTLTHVDVTTLPPTEQRAQIAGSREQLQREFHIPVNFFCYPAGRYDAAAIAQVRAAGYLGATSTDPGLATPARMYTLPRIRIDGDETLATFAATLQQAAAAQARVERVAASSGGH